MSEAMVNNKNCDSTDASLCCCNSSDPPFDSALNPTFENDTIALETLKAAYLKKEAEMKRKAVLAKYSIKPTKRGRWYTRIDGEKHEFKEKEDLEKYILDYEAGKQRLEQEEKTVTIEKIWDAFEALRAVTVAETTVVMDERYKKMYIETSPIYTADVTTLNRDDALQFFYHCKNTKHTATPRKGHEGQTQFREKYWQQIRAVVSALWDYMVEMNYVDINIFKSLRIHKDAFDPPLEKTEEETVFSASEALAVKQAAIKDAETNRTAVPYGILILFALGLRIGELCALKWKDIIQKSNGKHYLHIQREVVRKKDGGYKILPHTKSKAGDRFLQLNDYCIDIFRRIKLYNANKGICVTDPGEFVFQRRRKGSWTFCTVSSFRTRLDRYCHKAGIPAGKEKSHHDVRRTCLTVMYDSGMPIKQLQYFAGHDSVEQTLAYIRRRSDDIIDEFIIDDRSLFDEKPVVTTVTDLRAV